LTDVVICAEALAKKYVIGQEADRPAYATLRDVVAGAAKKVARTASDLLHGRAVIGGRTAEDFWALKDINFEIKRGEVVGIIGRNGAGKSTLLKILSRITEPSKGRVELRGRVASLLEVGTGFHPELTGRENIFLNGAILGMTRREIRRKFDEIVAFAEVERFLDTPVKRYSSGMYVRLAFAVAAHLDPEILVIDEVLAVGDMGFQRKCLGKMQDVAKGGRTVLFVSHNLTAVIDLTTRALLLERGHLMASGPSRQVVSQFMRMMQTSMKGTSDLFPFRQTYRSAGYVDIRSVRICGADLGAAVLEYGQDLSIDVDLTVKRPVEDGIVNIIILNEQLQPITTLASGDSAFFYSLPPGAHTLHCNAGALPLSPGDYFLTVGVAQKGGRLSWDVLETLPGFRIEAFNSSAWFNWPNRPGVVLFDHCQWYVDGSELHPHHVEARQVEGARWG
jgi:lipopolysaccharide transport system ATP-binding protein